MLSRSRFSLLIWLFMALVILAACIPTPAAPPATPPAAPPTEAPVDNRAGASAHRPAEDAQGQFMAVGCLGRTGRAAGHREPANYRVTFNTDVSLAITADCNNAVGFYQGEGGNLSVEIGPVAMAGCSPESKQQVCRPAGARGELPLRGRVSDRRGARGDKQHKDGPCPGRDTGCGRRTGA